MNPRSYCAMPVLKANIRAFIAIAESTKLQDSYFVACKCVRLSFSGEQQESCTFRQRSLGFKERKEKGCFPSRTVRPCHRFQPKWLVEKKKSDPRKKERLRCDSLVIVQEKRSWCFSLPLTHHTSPLILLIAKCVCVGGWGCGVRTVSLPIIPQYQLDVLRSNSSLILFIRSSHRFGSQSHEMPAEGLRLFTWASDRFAINWGVHKPPFEFDNLLQWLKELRKTLT